MPQDSTYFIYFAVGAAILALFMRARRHGGSQIAVVCAIVAVIGLLLVISSLLA